MTNKKIRGPGPKPALPPWVLVVIYFIILCLTGQTIAAMDPLQEMLKLNGALSHLDTIDRDLAIKAVVGLGVSFSVLGGMFVGIYLDYVGPKITALTGMGLQISGLFLMFFTSSRALMSLGAIFLGFAFQAILNSHICIGVFFPEKVGFVLAVIGAGPDVSLFLPALMKMVIRAMGDTPTAVRTIVGIYMAVAGGCAVVDLFLVPLDAFEAESSGSNEPLESEPEQHTLTGALTSSSDSTFSEDEQQQLLARNTASTSKHRTSHRSSTRTGDSLEGDKQLSYSEMPLSQQLRTIHFWIFVPFFVLNFARRKNFSTNVRGMFIQIAGDEAAGGSYADAFNSLVSLCSIPALAWGLLSDRFGVTVSTFANNSFGLALCLFPLIPMLQVQWLTIISYICNSSYVFGLLFAFCANTYGFSTLASLQGIASTIAGVVSILLDLFWNPFVANVLGGNYVSMNIILLCISLLMYAIPIFLTVRPPPRDDRVLQELLDEEERDQFSALRGSLFPQQKSTLYFRHTTGQFYNQRFLEMAAEQAKKAAKSGNPRVVNII